MSKGKASILALKKIPVLTALEGQQVVARLLLKIRCLPSSKRHSLNRKGASPVYSCMLPRRFGSDIAIFLLGSEGKVQGQLQWGDLATWFTSIVALLALALTVVQWWRNESSRYRLIVMPPAITQTNEQWPSLIFDLAAVNTGGRDAILFDVIVGLRANSKDTGITLHAQRILSHSLLGGLPLDPGRTEGAVFLPILFRRNEQQILRLLCAPFEGPPLSLDAIQATDQLEINLRVNGEKRTVFSFPYVDYREKYQGKFLNIPQGGFSTRWFRDAPEAYVH